MEMSFDEIKSLKSGIISFDFKPQTFSHDILISLNDCVCVLDKVPFVCLA